MKGGTDLPHHHHLPHLPQDLPHKLPTALELERILQPLVGQDLIIFTTDQYEIQGKLSSLQASFIELIPGSTGLVVKNRENLARRDGFSHLWVTISNTFGIQP
jgi:hypothetical protein